MFHCSAAEGARFQEEVTRISKLIEKLGKNPLKPSLDEKKDDSKKEKNKAE